MEDPIKNLEELLQTSGFDGKKALWKKEGSASAIYVSIQRSWSSEKDYQIITVNLGCQPLLTEFESILPFAKLQTSVCEISKIT